MKWFYLNTQLCFYYPGYRYTDTIIKGLVALVQRQFLLALEKQFVEKYRFLQSSKKLLCSKLIIEILKTVRLTTMVDLNY